MLGVFRRCWLPLVCAGGALGLWHTPVGRPLTLFMVQVHESLHVGAALVTGGRVTKLAIHEDGKGRTVSQNESIAVVATAGYMGSVLLGVVLVYASTRPWLLRLTVGALGLGAMAVAQRYAAGDNLAYDYGMVGGAFLLAGAAGFTRDALRVSGTALGVMLCLFTLSDFRGDLWVRPQDTDAGVLVRALGRPDLLVPVVWAWAGVSLGAMAWALWRVDLAGRRQGRRHGPGWGQGSAPVGVTGRWWP